MKIIIQETDNNWSVTIITKDIASIVEDTKNKTTTFRFNSPEDWRLVRNTIESCKFDLLLKTEIKEDDKCIILFRGEEYIYDFYL